MTDLFGPPPEVDAQRLAEYSQTVQSGFTTIIVAAFLVAATSAQTSRGQGPRRTPKVQGSLQPPTVLGPAQAPKVQLAIRDGRVWLSANDASVSEILAEWSRVGQTQIVNGDRVPGRRITVQLTGVSESEALDLLLQAASGFVALQRAVELQSLSRFERILILPTSTLPIDPRVRAVAAPLPVPQPAPPVAIPTPTPGVQRLIGADGQPLPDDQQDAAPMPGVVPQPPSTPPVPALPAAPPTRTYPASLPGVPFPGMVPQPAQPPPIPQPTPPSQQR